MSTLLKTTVKGYLVDENLLSDGALEQFKNDEGINKFYESLHSNFSFIKVSQESVSIVNLLLLRNL